MVERWNGVEGWKGGQMWKVDRRGRWKVEGWKGGQTWKVGQTWNGRSGTLQQKQKRKNKKCPVRESNPGRCNHNAEY